MKFKVTISIPDLQRIEPTEGSGEIRFDTIIARFICNARIPVPKGKEKRLWKEFLKNLVEENNA